MGFTVINRCPDIHRSGLFRDTVLRPGFKDILLPVNRIYRLRLFLRCLRSTFLDEILPLLDSNFCFLCTTFYCPNGLAAHKLSCLLGAVNRIAARWILLLHIFRLGGFPNFLGKLIPGKFQRPLLWQDIFALFLLNRGTRLDRHSRVFFSYDSDKMHLLKYRKMRPNLAVLTNYPLPPQYGIMIEAGG